MKQVLVKKGKVFPANVPAPTVSKGSVLIKVVNSCISAGTELSGVAFSGSSLIKKAMDQPHLVNKVIDFARSEGIAKTIQRVRGALEEGKPTGYSVAGIILAVGDDVKEFSPGDWVAAAGAGIANHAEFVDVPKNLVMRIPGGLDFAKASTVTLGGIALQGVRRCDLRLGEFCVVVGTGILGLLSVQLLRLSGVRVIAVDIDERRLSLAKELGAEEALNPFNTDAVASVLNVTGGHGSDAVLFTAATGSSDPLSQSFRMCKKRGRVVLVGVSGMEIKREDMYEKELDLLISTSYGPGRYDRNYEEKGLDYPYGYVRWTENRNMSEYLRLVASGAVNLDKVITATYPIADVGKAFSDLTNPEKKPIISLLDYGPWEGVDLGPAVHSQIISHRTVSDRLIKVGLIGAGSFATSVHLPNLTLMKNRYEIRGIMSPTGHKAKAAAERFGASYAATDANVIINDADIDLVMIATRHENHAELTLKALQAGKHVFVEKPLATDNAGLEAIEKFYETQKEQVPLLMVGFNRRFSPYAQEIKKLTQQRTNPLFMHYRMNAGYIPLDHWVHDSGGRIIGEACHIIDLMTFLTSSVVESINAESLRPSNDRLSAVDNKSIQLKYADGSVCTIEYFAVGNTLFPKERLEVHFDQKTIVMDDYRSMELFGLTGKALKTSTQQKGHAEELEALADSLTGKSRQWPIEFWDLIQTTRVSLMVGG